MNQGLGQHYFPYEPWAGSWPFPGAETGPGFFNWFDHIGIPQITQPPVELPIQKPPEGFEVTAETTEGNGAIAQPQPIPIPEGNLNWVWLFLLGLGVYYFWFREKQ